MIDLWVSAVAFLWREETPYVLGLVAALLALLFLESRDDIRRAARNTALLYLLSLAAQAAAAATHAVGLQAAAPTIYEFAILLGGIAIIRLLGLFLFRTLLPRLGAALPHIMEDLLVMLGYIAWGMVRLRYAGMDLSGIVTTSAVITAIIAFSMQDTLGNVLGGLALQLDASIHVGDWLRVEDVSGRVTDISWRATSLETPDGETVVIPNSALMKTRFRVLGRHAGGPVQMRRPVAFDVDLAVPPARVREVAEKAVREASIENVAAEPAPDCVLLDFANGVARYALRYWLTELSLEQLTDTAVRTHVLAALQREGWRLAAPEHRVSLVHEGEEHDAAVREREITRRLDALGHVELFAGLRPKEFRALAERLVHAPFAKGDIITRQGAVANWLYILTSGEAEVVVDTPEHGRNSVGMLRVGDFFGELGLMTGAPRSATVIAAGDVQCYRLDKDGFRDVLRGRPELAEEISRVLVERQAATDSALIEVDEAQRQERMSERRSELAGRIRKFFGMD